jgi:hypothetical protein
MDSEGNQLQTIDNFYSNGFNDCMIQRNNNEVVLGGFFSSITINSETYSANSIVGITNLIDYCFTVSATTCQTNLTLTATTIIGPYVDCDTCTVDYNCYCQCKEYLINNTQEYSAYISYYDCYGNEQNVIVPGLTELNICACEDTVIVPPGVILTLEGDIFNAYLTIGFGSIPVSAILPANIERIT